MVAAVGGFARTGSNDRWYFDEIFIKFVLVDYYRVMSGV